MNIAESAESKCCGTCGCRAVAAVMPRMDDRVSSLIAEREALFNLTHTYGSPLQIVLPQAAQNNWLSFSRVLSDNSIQGRALFTTKPNKSKSILQLLAAAGAAADVSSEGALRHALSCGLPGQRIQASGPKSLDYLRLAAVEQATISIDSLDELARLRELSATASGLPRQHILLRISGFKSSRVHFTKADAPFGVRMELVGDALSLLRSMRDRVEFRGVHFHLLGGDNDERVMAFENALEVILRSRELGMSPSVINIGGGYRIRYAADADEWQRFQSYLRAAVLGKVDPITWDGAGLGFRAQDGRVVGAPAFLDHCPRVVGAEELASFLKQPCPSFDSFSVGDLVRDMMLELHVEPGRAVLDQAGITVARVASVKESALGKKILMLEMNHSNLRSREQKLLTQPVFLPLAPRAPSSVGYFLFGSLCIADDLIQSQKVYPGFEILRDDLVVFINTAAYHMDFAEAEVLHHRLPRKIAAIHSAGAFEFYDDAAVGQDRLKSWMECR